MLLSGHFLRFIQVGDAYIAGMAEPYLTDQHSAVRVVEFGLAMIKVLERIADEDGVHSSLDTHFTYTCYSIYRYIYIIFILIIILVILLIFHPTENLQRFGMDWALGEATAKWSERLRQRGDDYKDANVRCRVGWALSTENHTIEMVGSWGIFYGFQMLSTAEVCIMVNV